MFGKRLRALVPLIIGCLLIGCMLGGVLTCGAEEARFVTDYKVHWQVHPASYYKDAGDDTAKTADTATFFVAEHRHGQEAEIERLVKENKTLAAANANLRDEVRDLQSKLQAYAVAATVGTATAPATCDPNDPNCRAGGTCAPGTACNAAGGGCGNGNACGAVNAGYGSGGGFRGRRPGNLLRRVFSGRRGGGCSGGCG